MANSLIDDFNEILDMAAGGGGGVKALYIIQWLRACDEQGTDVPFVRQFAKMCRLFEKGWPGGDIVE